MKQILISITLLMLFIVAVSPGLAQGQEPLTVSVDRATLSTDETLALSVSINAAVTNPPQPVLPSLAGFTVLGSSTSSQISIINGALDSQVVYTYRLQPYETGELVIEPISVTLDRQTYSTEPIRVQVTQGTGQATQPAGPSLVAPSNPTAPTSASFAGQDVFIEAEVDNPTPFLGQQVSYTFRYYEAFDRFGFDQPHYEPPTFTGFWSESQAEQSRYQVQAAGRNYQVTELRTVLFPTKLGPISIDPAQLTIPGGFFSRGGQLQTEPVEVEVRPLPAGAPESFSGAVGQYSMTDSVDTTEGQINEPITWQVTLSGQGNIHTLPDLNWPDLEGWRSFDSQATINTELRDGQIVGTRQYERLLVPQSAGEFLLPAVEFSYYDPTLGSYQTRHTEPVRVTVEPGSGLPAPSYAPPADDPPTVEQPPAVQPLKPVSSRLNLARPPLTSSPLYWLAWVIPALGLVFNAAWRRRQAYRGNNPHLVKRSQAFNQARRALAQAQSQQQGVYETSIQILIQYLEAKLGEPLAGLTRRSLGQRLTTAGLDAHLIGRVQVCLIDAEMGRYAPEAGDEVHAQDLLGKIEQLIDDLEQVFRSQ